MRRLEYRFGINSTSRSQCKRHQFASNRVGDQNAKLRSEHGPTANAGTNQWFDRVSLNGRTRFGRGHSCQLQSLSTIRSERPDSFPIVSHRVSNPADRLKMRAFRGGPVQRLWLVPVISSRADNSHPRKIELDTLL